MYQSNLALSIKREFSSKASTASHKWLERAGFITQHTAGINYYGHLFIKTLNKLENLINTHLENIGATQVQLPQLQCSSIWQESGRWDAYNDDQNSGAMFTTKGRNGQLFTLAATAEEAATEYMKICNFTATKFPEKGVTIFQHGNKLRDELRAAGGIVRGKEFRMMDAYSFSATEEGLNESYMSIRKALTELLDTLNLDYAFVTADSGDIGGSVSEELMVFSDIGGDVVWTDESGQSANEEVAEQITWVGEIKKRKAIEVGHIFQLCTKYSEAMNLKWDSAEGRRTVHMGCYGIGTSRLIAAYVQQNHDEQGLIWNNNLSAYDIHILQLGKDDVVSNLSNRLEKHLIDKRYSVLVDDRKKVKNGAKFAESDILGLSKQIIIGKKNAEEDMVEIKDRRTGERVIVSIHDVINELNKKVELK